MPRMRTFQHARVAGRWRRAVLVVCVLLAGAATGMAQSPPPASSFPLSRLTLAQTDLPGGCALESLEPDVAAPSRLGSPTIRMWSREPFPANPWSGSESRFVAAVRAAFDPSPRVPRPDGQLVETDAQFLTARAEGTREAYRAAYISGEDHRVQVFAVTFDDEALVKGEPVSMLTNPPRGMRTRFVRGATVVVVSAPMPDECARAVEAHLRSIV
jgi:hypothetical protein